MSRSIAQQSPSLELEQDLQRRLGKKAARIAGIDEAGRGPLAGPVVAAAVVLDANRIPEGIDDSKKLSASAREALAAQIKSTADVGVAIVGVDEIDLRNILNATMDAMAKAIGALDKPADALLIDGNRAPLIEPICETVVGGDARSLSIAAASIVAKVTRDRIMQDLAERYPGYGWERNMGYGTREHIESLQRLGVTPEHRRSFAPVRKMLSP